MTTTYEELRASALQMQADAYRAAAEAEAVSPNCGYTARMTEVERYCQLAEMYDGMASAYRAMIPATTNAQEGTVQ